VRCESSFRPKRWSRIPSSARERIGCSRSVHLGFSTGLQFGARRLTGAVASPGHIPAPLFALAEEGKEAERAGRVRQKKCPCGPLSGAVTGLAHESERLKVRQPRLNLRIA
jgi:hypothetical protein